MVIEDLLRACTVRVDGGPKPGVGFFVAPGVVMTCAHVAGERADALAIVFGDKRLTSVTRVTRLVSRGRPIAVLDEYPDLAVLDISVSDHPCVWIDEERPTTADRFQIYGYPEEGSSVNLTPAMLDYRGVQGDEPTQFIDLMSDTVKRGMSGAALLRLGSGGVCGVMVATRDAVKPDGGLAIAWAAVSADLEELLAANRAFHARDGQWQRASERSREGRIRFGLPLMTRHFRGREPELRALDRAMGRDDRAVVSQAIIGLGGVGKSQLAVAYVQAHADEYAIVAWITAEDGGVADLAKLAGRLGIATEGITSIERAERAVDWLASTEQRWLLVLDNVTDAQQLTTCLPGGNGRVLITSRNQKLDAFAQVVSIDVFDHETAVDYLLARAGRHQERDAAGRLAETLGRLPLALSHAGAYCASGASFDDYLELLGALPAAELFDSSPEDSYEQTVAATWNVSIQAAADRAKLARSVLELAAFLAPDDIPVGLFDVLANTSTPGGRKQLHDALDAADMFSLIHKERSTVSVHRLLQKVIRDDAAARSEPRGALAALQALQEALPKDAGAPASWPLLDDLASHVMALARCFPDLPDAGPAICWAANQVTLYRLHSEDTIRAPESAALSLNLAERLLGPEHPDTLTARGNLAGSHWLAGRTADAIELQERVLADRERLLGPENRDTVALRGNLAVSYWSAGRTGDAIELLERVLADSERLLGPEHPDTLALRANLAASCWSAGRTGDAIELLERVLADSERLLGPEHPDTLATRGDLAASYLSAGRTGDAIKLLERVLADSERLLGPEHPGTLRALGNLAASYLSAGRTGDAIELLERVLADRERLLGPEHPDTLRALGNLAGGYRSAGRTGDAIGLLERVLADSERLLGPEHPDTLATGSDLAASYFSAGRTADAIELLERGLTNSERLLGPDHPNTQAVRAALTAACQQIEDP